jgi:hypothetical protein
MRKKILVSALVLAVVGLAVLPAEESKGAAKKYPKSLNFVGLGFGMTYDNIKTDMFGADKVSDHKFNAYSLGVELTSYRFFGGTNMGVCVDGIIGLPVSLHYDGKTFKSDLSFLVDMIVGFGMIFPINNTFDIAFGVGPGFGLLAWAKSSDSYMPFGIGVGATVNANINFTDTISLGIGASFKYDFVLIDAASVSSGSLKGSRINVRPSILFGWKAPGSRR